MSPLRSVLRIGLFVSAVAASTTAAFASDKSACLDASLEAQVLRNNHKLIAAYDQLRLCVAPQCPDVVKADCAVWLAEVEKALPSVVLSAKNGTGADLVDVTVHVDGKLVKSRLDGVALTLDPGLHTFKFELADGTSAGQALVVQEGDKSRRVAVVLGPLPAPARAPAPPPSSAGPWKTAGWAAGGAGVLGLAIGTVVGVVALAKKSKDCPTSTTCQDGSLSGLRTEATISDVGLIGGGLLLAGGAAMILFAPKGGHESRASAVGVTPVVTATGAQVMLGGRW